MSSGSPSAYLLWAILSSIFLVFLFLHLWAYDRFNCLKWHSGRQPGAFKRVMTYDFQLPRTPIRMLNQDVPCATNQVLIFGNITSPRRLQRGYDHFQIQRGIYLFARPRSSTRTAAIAWSLEIVTHLEELAFWLFLLHQGPGKRDWFHSWEFRTWYLGSIVAILGMPLTTLITRREIERVQAWIFLSGSSAGTFTTIFFLYVLARFPGFIRYVKDGGAEPDVVVRLATFYHLNRIRVLFRFLFTIPLLIIAVDGLKGPYPIVGDPFALDFLLMMGGLGCFISSAITLLIFFPRSITRESGYKAKIISPQNSAKVPTLTSPLPDYYVHNQNMPDSPKSYFPESDYHFHHEDGDPVAIMSDEGGPQGVYRTQSQPVRPRPSTDGEMSPGYESDSDSISVTTPTNPIPMQDYFARPQTHVRAESGSTGYNNSGTTQTMVSRPTSGGRSDDTRWERTETQGPEAVDHTSEPLRNPSSTSPRTQVEVQERATLANSSQLEAEGRTRRRYSDGFFMYNRRGNSLFSSLSPPVGHGQGRSAVTSEDAHSHSHGNERQSQQSNSRGPSTHGHGPERRGRERGRVRDVERGVGPSTSAASTLHPYVINFTSPIDLLDYDPRDDPPYALPSMPARV
ncbi:hypothetical protein CVT24_009475 [Panaeolus cyanescens]|uniref:Uncharacterized protein n=1 Tax=Panaeolus cyanescens TaxID=181874 RepID=A0A409WRL3_9AGAR|nr:hypothetical protein CVT24_009475 [Panaeolus cyanescens]